MYVVPQSHLPLVSLHTVHSWEIVRIIVWLVMLARALLQVSQSLMSTIFCMGEFLFDQGPNSSGLCRQVVLV